MCQNGIVLILVSTFCYGLCLPVKGTANQTVSSELQTLANNCGNAFLSDIIKSKIEYCNVPEQSHSKKDYECLMFNDINTQLCATFERIELDLKTNYENNLNNTPNIDTICKEVKDWKAVTTNFKEKFQMLAEKPRICLQVCATEDPISDNANFFCKYYKWGSNMILSFKSTIPQTSSVISSTNSETKTNISTASETSNNAAPSQIENIEIPRDSPSVQSINTSSVHKQVSEIKSDIPKEQVNEQIISKDSSTLQKPDLKESNNKPVEPSSLKSEIEKPVDEPATKPVENKSHEKKLPPVEEKSKDTMKIDEDNLDNDPENDLEPDDGPFSDTDNMEGDDMSGDPKIEPEKPKENSNINKLPLTSFNVDVPQRDIVYPNTVQDTFVEEDDHFFPFFLTTIVLVVLLYVLYHNKSKVTKLILGLIVEGRQSNRRRNSRGHAYRRLDTLEQAMSASSTAPPSKIIY